MYFEINMPPFAQQRPRFSKIGKSVKIYDPSKGKKFLFRTDLKRIWRYKPTDETLGVNLEFHMPIPKSFSKKKRALAIDGTLRHIVKPDIDNMAKGVLDAMNGIVYKDDCQITSISAFKCYSEFPRISVEILLLS
jgi:Holliday junction resolvase RusA-like endonuclease